MRTVALRLGAAAAFAARGPKAPVVGAVGKDLGGVKREGGR
jgi:hypothetical protein